jgi:hypothetical protein
MDKVDQAEKVNVKFIGDPNDDFSGPSVMKLWGHEFKKGEFTPVPSSVGEKALAHNHFQVEGHEEEAEHQHEMAQHEPDVLRNVLDRRGVAYPKNANRAKLSALVSEGGPPTEEELAE